MSIQIVVTKKMSGKRKKYKSFKEMPDDLRQALEKTMIPSDPGTQMDTETTIVVDGKAYDNIEDMPPDIRVIYAKAIESLRKGKSTHDSVPLSDASLSSRNMSNTSLSYTNPEAIEPQSSLSSLPRWLIIGGVFIATFMFLYVIIYAVW